MYHLSFAVVLCLYWTDMSKAADSIAAVRTNTASDIVPMWDCWFNTYPHQSVQPVLNLVFGYNNTQDFEITVAATSTENRLDPAQFNGYQPFIFKPGLNRFAMVLQDARGLLAGRDGTSIDNAHIQWFLGDKSVLVSQQMVYGSSGESLSNRCDRKYEGVCPTRIDGFCDDTLYCNGQETCFTAISHYRQLQGNVLGRCKNANEGVRCSVSEICNETQRACVLNAPPPPPTPSVVPLFKCWYYAPTTSINNNDIGQSAPMHVHLVLGYNNQGQAPVSRGITMVGDQSAVKNNIAPDPYNSLQPVLFRVGLVDEAFTLVDTLDVLRQRQNSIVWSLTDQRLDVHSTDLTDERICAGRNGDGVVPTKPSPPVGIITVPPSPPTTTIDQPPTPTRQPAEVVTPSDSWGDNVSDMDETGDVIATQCSISNTDCTPYDSFCLGRTQCDLGSGLCVLVDPQFSPCDVRAGRRRPGTQTALQCVEHASQCIAVVSSCYRDRDCNDGFICNGQERCVNGTCVAVANQTVQTVCGYTNAICIEHVGCKATDQMDGRVVYGITLGVLAAVAILLFLLYVWQGTNGNNDTSKPKSS